MNQVNVYTIQLFKLTKLSSNSCISSAIPPTPLPLFLTIISVIINLFFLLIIVISCFFRLLFFFFFFLFFSSLLFFFFYSSFIFLIKFSFPNITFSSSFFQASHTSKLHTHHIHIFYTPHSHAQSFLSKHPCHLVILSMFCFFHVQFTSLYSCISNH